MRKMLFIVLSLFCFSANAGLTNEICARFKMKDGSYSHGYVLKVKRVTGDELNNVPYIKGRFSSGSSYFLSPRDDGGYYILKDPGFSMTKFLETHDQYGKSWIMNNDIDHCF